MANKRFFLKKEQIRQLIPELGFGNVDDESDVKTAPEFVNSVEPA